MTSPHSPFHPIIYVRGYAMTQAEIDQTTADPFCGFNLGSTTYRAVAERNRPPRKFVFESPLVRLVSEFGYQDVYQGGYDILDAEWQDNPANRLSSRSIIIHRFYDQASSLLGLGEPPSLANFASRLGELIMRVRELVCDNPDNGIGKEDFRCYLVAHSMGGLVCRGLLQNPLHDPLGAARHVAKLFTYATPHNGIEMLGVNPPSWLNLNAIDSFNRDKLATFFGLEQAYARHGRVDLLPQERYPSEQVFCMVGTNRLDYEAALGLSRTFVGHGSDGLVRIANATLQSLDAHGELAQPCAKAFAYRSHSGFFGLVNSEEAYQNLVRFLFGDVRVDLWLDIEAISLPAPVDTAQRAGRQVNALYQIETLAAPRGKLWYLTRRTAEEDSVTCLSHQDWLHDPQRHGIRYLSSVFLARRAKVNHHDDSLTYTMTLNVRVPDYEIERTLWVDQHFEGSYLFRNALLLKLFPARDNDPDAWRLEYAWQDQGLNQALKPLTPSVRADGKLQVSVPFDSRSTPGIKGQLRLVLSAWNGDAQLRE
ncbi:MAG: hypothetical protein ABWY06_07150 [Pseudomonas sp.]|uniref:esterase/lipase family protein n=1 Tax=Pseudomonas sp. TaxID=306 RepID=UPI00339304D7